MHAFSMPLTIAVAAFLLVLLWRVRPQLGWGRQTGASRQAIKDAKSRIEAAQGDDEKARALCEAGELLAPASAEGFYLRAVRTAPASTEVLARVIAGLARRPRILESVLWRHLAAASWTDTRVATLASLAALVALYEGPLRDSTRAKALKNAAGVLGG
jgi:hypothetical protein